MLRPYHSVVTTLCVRKPVSRCELYHPAYNKSRRQLPRTTYIKHANRMAEKTADELTHLATDRESGSMALHSIFNSKHSTLRFLESSSESFSESGNHI